MAKQNALFSDYSDSIPSTPELQVFLKSLNQTISYSVRCDLVLHSGGVGGHHSNLIMIKKKQKL